MDPIEVPVRKLIKKPFFFPNQTIPKCDRRKFLSPITIIMITSMILFLISIIIHYIIYILSKKDDFKFEITTFCTKYLGELNDNIYVFNGVPYAVTPTYLKFSVKDILGRQLSQDSLRWLNSVKLNSIETCYASHSDHCNFNNSIWRCTNNKLRKRCINFQGDFSTDSKDSKSNSRNDFDEDCLYLNIKVPKRKPSASPVILFMSGTNYATDISNKLGKNYPFEPSGSFVNDVDSIVVSLNYRLGPFGSFFDHHLKLTNFVISDILVALHWLKLNIEKFGGNKNKIVLLGHGTGATIGLSILLHSSHMFQSAWLASGSVHIPKSNEFLKSRLKDLFVMKDKRCISDSFYHRFCEKRYAELLTVSSYDIVNLFSKHYDSENSLSSLLDIESILNKEQIQQPFLPVDFQTIIDSPLNLIYKNMLPSIPIVFTSMLSELDGFPGEREWNLKTTNRIEKEISNMLLFLFTLSKVQNAADVSNSIMTKIKATAKAKKKSMGEIALEIFSLLRVTCPIYFLSNEIRKLGKNEILNIIHTEPPAQPIRGMLFPKIVKRFPFYGFDILLLLRKENIFIKKISEENKNYQEQLFNIFKEYVHGNNLNQIKRLNSATDKLYALNNYGLHKLDHDGYVELCNKLDYRVLVDFLVKIN